MRAILIILVLLTAPAALATDANVHVARNERTEECVTTDDSGMFSRSCEWRESALSARIALDDETLVGASWGESGSRESEWYHWGDGRWETGRSSSADSLTLEAAGQEEHVATSRCHGEEDLYETSSERYHRESSRCEHGIGAAGTWAGMGSCESGAWSYDSSNYNRSESGHSCALLALEQGATLPPHGTYLDGRGVVLGVGLGEAGSRSCDFGAGAGTCDAPRHAWVALHVSTESGAPIYSFSHTVAFPEVLA